MHARALSRALFALVIGATLMWAAPSYADADPEAPVVVNDTVTLWPYQTKTINVLANDSDPAGDDLALCRFPATDFETSTLPTVLVQDLSEYGQPVGTLMVGLLGKAPATTTIDYYVCNHTRLTPATLTINVRATEPVDVDKITGRPGRLRVTNHNDRDVTFWFGSQAAVRPDGKVTIPADSSRVVRVQRHAIVWAAVIGHRGIADHGRVRHIELNGPALPEPKHGIVIPGGKGVKGGKGDLGGFRTARGWVR